MENKSKIRLTPVNRRDQMENSKKRIIKFNDELNDDSELYVCPSCDAHLHVDCVSDKCPVCNAEIEDEEIPSKITTTT